MTNGIVRTNTALTEEFYLLTVECALETQESAIVRGASPVTGGQFCMLRAWDDEPLLSRPISVYDAADGTVTFLYKTVGRGTELFARLKPGDEMTLLGPLGNGFPRAAEIGGVQGTVALVGGGAGIAPFYLTAKQLREAGVRAEVFLGFSGEAFLRSAYEEVADSVKINVGGFVTDDVDCTKYDALFACGPEVMLRALYDKCTLAGAASRLWVSLESRMACGVGACYGCSRKTTSGNKKVCRDGPVFAAAEVFDVSYN